MATTIPIIVAGRSPQIGASVVKNLAPEIEVIHFVFNVELAISDVPPILKGQQPPAHDTHQQVGSGNYARLPACIVPGGGYNDEDLTRIQSALDQAGAPLIPFIRPDMNVSMPPVGPEYGVRIAQRTKQAVLELFNSGKLGVGKSGLYWY